MKTKNLTSNEISDSVKHLFRGRGFKCTPQRLTVLRVLERSPTHLSINDIHDEVKRILPETGLATVYRSLETLIDLDLAVKVHLEDGCHSYAISPEGHRHPIVCTECDRVVEFAECPLDAISDKVSENTGFKIQKHFLQLFGKCEQCQV